MTETVEQLRVHLERHETSSLFRYRVEASNGSGWVGEGVYPTVEATRAAVQAYAASRRVKVEFIS
jgi:hypothetical protein